MRYDPYSYAASHGQPRLVTLAWLFFLAAAVGGPSRGEAKTWDVIVVEDVMVPMRDGVKLATDLYVPAQHGYPVATKLPAVLSRTPYNKEAGGKSVARFFAENGYLSVAQDCRGRFKSEGVFFPFRDEPQDGYDTIEWLAGHPFCNGKVGMHGVSYMGWVQFEAAALNPPALVTMIPHCGPTNAYYYSMHVGGTLTLGLLQWHLGMAMSSQEAQRDPRIAKAIKPMRTGQDFLRWAARLPWKRGQTPLSLAPQYEDAAFKFYFENYDYNDFWRQPGLAMDEYFDSFPDIPILWVVGWYEVYPRSIVDGFQEFLQKKRANQYLLAGPWTHANFNPSCGDANFGSQAGEVPGFSDFGPDGSPGVDRGYQPILQYELAWFDRWLKADESVDLGKPVKAFVMGGGDGKRHENGRLNHGGRWHQGDIWPPEKSRPTKFYLHDDGMLSQSKPTRPTSSTTYTYDPRNTVSSDGRCEVGYGAGLAFGFGGMGPRDQIQQETLPGHGIPGMPIASRDDVLVFQTSPLPEDVKIAGNIRAVLSVSSDAPDTDFFVKLIDVYPPSSDYPAGYSFPVTDGVLRARYRNGFAKPTMMEAGKVVEIKIPIQPAANLFKSNHRIRIDICSSNFPNFDINRNTGDPKSRRWRLADNTVYHEAGSASYIELPLSHP